jgi:uncharacterized tellurite resistance protein B-like protein
LAQIVAPKKNWIMLNKLKNLLFAPGKEDVAAGAHDMAELHHAAAGLLVEAAILDGHFHDDERARIETLLADRFELDMSEVSTIIEAAEAAADERVELFTITQTVRAHFDAKERIEMIEMLWEVVYADGKLDDYESNLMRRATGLLYVTDRDSSAARKRVIKRLN